MKDEMRRVSLTISVNVSLLQTFSLGRVHRLSKQKGFFQLKLSHKLCDRGYSILNLSKFH